MLDPYRMAQKLHRKLVDEIADTQAKILLTERLVAEFGADAIPIEPLLRSYDTCLRNAAKTNADLLARWRVSLQENLDTVRQLELMFQQKRADDMEAFGDWIRSTHGKPNKVPATPKPLKDRT